MQVETPEAGRSAKQRPQRRKREVFDNQQESSPPPRTSSQEKYKQQIVTIDNDCEEQTLGGTPCYINTSFLAAQKQAIEARNKTTTTKNFVRNSMYYGEEIPEYEMVSMPNIEIPQIVVQQQAKSQEEIAITPMKQGNRVVVREAGNEQEEGQREQKKQVKTASKPRRRDARQVFGEGSDEQPQVKQPTMVTEPGEGDETPAKKPREQPKVQAKKPNIAESVTKPPETSQTLTDPPVPLETPMIGNLFTIHIDSETDLKQFFYRSLPKGTIMQTQIRRYSEGLQTRYQLFLDDMRPLMCAEHRASVGCNMHISMNRDMDRKSKHYLGKLRSNMLGSMYSIYGAGENPKSTNAQKDWRALMGNVEYENNFMGLKGPRRINVKIPTVATQFPENLYKVSDDQTMWNLQTKHPNSVMSFRNREPRWNERLKSYALNFGGRVKQASIKNFILVEYEPALQRVSYVNALIFGKISQTKFSLEFTHPFSPMQAFCIALSSFDSKLNCE